MPTVTTTRSLDPRSLALRVLAASAAALLLASLAAPALAHGDHDHGSVTTQRGQALGRISPGIGAELAAARAATARYHDVAVAMGDGYAPATPCVEDPNGAGAMGIHYVNPGRFGSDDPTKPAALLYHPGLDGQLRLVGVEYIDPDPEAVRELFGQPFTDFVPGIGENAALHVWLWQANPAGMFASYNPNLSCPDA